MPMVVLTMTEEDVESIEVNGEKYIKSGLYNICRWWIETYPDDIFVNKPKEVTEIRARAKKILEKREVGGSSG